MANNKLLFPISSIGLVLLLISSACGDDPAPSPSPSLINSWCSPTPNPVICQETLNGCPASELKGTPLGASLILMEAANATFGPANALIDQGMSSSTNGNYTDPLYCWLFDCKYAYASSGGMVSSINPTDLEKADKRRDISTDLETAANELKRSCRLTKMFGDNPPPVVVNVTNTVNNFYDLAKAAGVILKSIPA